MLPRFVCQAWVGGVKISPFSGRKESGVCWVEVDMGMDLHHATQRSFRKDNKTWGYSTILMELSLTAGILLGAVAGFRSACSGETQPGSWYVWGAPHLHGGIKTLWKWSWPLSECSMGWETSYNNFLKGILMEFSFPLAPSHRLPCTESGVGKGEGLFPPFIRRTENCDNLEEIWLV